MNDPSCCPAKRVVIVAQDRGRGLVLERALANRGWSATRVEHGREVPANELHGCLLLVLDNDDPDIFELLIRLSSSRHRPSVVLLTRRPHARMLDSAVLDSLGVDRLVAWPCRVDQIAATLEQAQGSHEPLRLVS